MKFRQAKKIMHGGSSIHKKFRKRRPPYPVALFDENNNEIGMKWCWPSLHDVDIIARARTVYLHHLKREKKAWQKKPITDESFYSVDSTGRNLKYIDHTKDDEDAIASDKYQEITYSEFVEGYEGEL